jgi:hypothetical protein
LIEERVGGSLPAGMSSKHLSGKGEVFLLLLTSLEVLGLGNRCCPYGPLHFAGTKTRCASVHSPGVTVYYGTDPLDVGKIRSLCLDVGMTHAVAYPFGFAADFTPGHEKNLLAGLTYDPSIVA